MALPPMGTTSAMREPLRSDRTFARIVPTSDRLRRVGLRHSPRSQFGQLRPGPSRNFPLSRRSRSRITIVAGSVLAAEPNQCEAHSPLNSNPWAEGPAACAIWFETSLGDACRQPHKWRHGSPPAALPATTVCAGTWPHPLAGRAVLRQGRRRP